MSPLFARTGRAPAEVVQRAALRRGDVLAHTRGEDGTWLLGTREELVVVPPDGEVLRIGWERVETADWDRDEERFRVTEVADFGRVRPQHTFTVAEPGRFLPLVRERVTASVLLQRRVRVDASRGLLVVARRTPGRDGEVTWAVDYDPGLDPDDPVVRLAAGEALEAAAAELGTDPASI